MDGMWILTCDKNWITSRPPVVVFDKSEEKHIVSITLPLSNIYNFIRKCHGWAQFSLCLALYSRAAHFNHPVITIYNTIMNVKNNISLSPDVGDNTISSVCLIYHSLDATITQLK